MTVKDGCRDDCKDEAAGTTVRELIARSNRLGSDPRKRLRGGKPSAQGTAVEFRSPGGTRVCGHGWW